MGTEETIQEIAAQTYRSFHRPDRANEVIFAVMVARLVNMQTLFPWNKVNHLQVMEALGYSLPLGAVLDKKLKSGTVQTIVQIAKIVCEVTDAVCPYINNTSGVA